MLRYVGDWEGGGGEETYEITWAGQEACEITWGGEEAYEITWGEGRKHVRSHGREGRRHMRSHGRKTCVQVHA